MTIYLKRIVFASLFSALTCTATWAEDIAAILAGSSGDAQITLSEDSIADNITISGRAVRISSAGDASKLISNASGAPLFAVVDGGHLTLDFVSLHSQDAAPSDTLVYVQDATLTLSNCILNTQRRFSVYLRAGTLNVTDCAFMDADTSVALTDGARGALTNVQFNNPTSGALWVTGAGSYAGLKDSEIAYGARGIAVDNGAQLLVERTGIYSTSEVGILADSAGVRLTDVWFEGVDNFAVYAQNQTNLVLEGGSIVGPIGTGVMMINSNAEVDGLKITEAQTGININGGATPVVLKNLAFQTGQTEAAHIIAEGGGLVVSDSSFEGGATGIGVISGSADLRATLISGQTSASIQINGGQGVGPVRLAALDLVPELEGVAIYANTPYELSASQIVYEGAALAGDGLPAADISNTLLLGPSDGAVTVGPAPRGFNFANDIIAAEDHRALWQAAVSAADVDSRRVALAAIATAFPRRTAQTPLAVLSLFDIEMGTTPAPAEWQFLGSLMRDTGGGDPVWLGDLTVGDLPLHLPSGQYVLETEGYSIPIDLTAAGAEHWLELPTDSAPYALYRGKGVPLRGPSFALRPQAELIKLMNSRWPGYGKYDRPAVAKPDATPDSRAAALGQARSDIAASLAYMDGLPKGMIYDDTTQEQRETITRHRYQESPLALRVLATQGSAEDAAWLLERALPHLGLAAEFWAREAVTTAVEIEARLGLLPTGRAAAAFDQFGAEYSDPRFPALTIAMASFGHADALAALVEAVAVDRATPVWNSGDAFRAFRLVMHVNAPEVTQLALEFVDAYQAQALLSMTEGVTPEPQLLGIYVYSAFYPAYLHAAAYAQGADRARLVVGIPQWNQMTELGPVFENPAGLFEHILGMNGPELRALRNSELAFAACDLIMGQPNPQQRYRDLENLLFQYGSRYPDDIPYPQLWGSNLVSAGVTHCQSVPASLSNLENPQNREASWFSSAWHFAFTHPAQALAEITSVSDIAIPNVDVADSAPAFLRDPALENTALTTGMARYTSYASVATTAFTAQTGPYASGTDMRMFLQPVEPEFEGHRLYWIGGSATLTPIELGDQTLFGLSLIADGAAFGGLGAAIARQPDILALNLDNHAAPMVQGMALRHGAGQVMQMDFLRTLDTGVHVYALPQTPEDQSNLIVDVAFATKGTEGQILRQWVISWPLYRSPFGFSKMRDTGRVTVKGMDQ